MPLPPARAAASASPSSGAGLTVVDYRKEALRSAPAPASGIITLTFDPVGPGVLWLVQRITVLCTSTTQTAAVVYAGAVDPSNMVDGTSSGNLDTADESSPVLVDSSISLTIQWTGASPGAIATARIQYQVVQRS